ncbi:hypothetical protein J6590_062359 [Homalodisca vitripennis]|nr:hypothetical protein J6590_101364 [Homalodisca vitripennis]KAG8256802.1 hypothetical protein J6590_062359 [Homalodisca vitripennis]
MDSPLSFAPPVFSRRTMDPILPPSTLNSSLFMFSSYPLSVARGPSPVSSAVSKDAFSTAISEPNVSVVDV